MLPWKETYLLFPISTKQIMSADHLPKDTICQCLLASPMFKVCCMVQMVCILYSLWVSKDIILVRDIMHIDLHELKVNMAFNHPSAPALCEDVFQKPFSHQLLSW